MGKTVDSKYLLALNAHEKIGSQTLKKIVAAFSDLEKLWHMPESKIGQRLEPKIVKLIQEARELYDPEKEVEKLHTHNIGYITLYDKEYPELLSEVYDAPMVLYIKGEIAAINSVGIAIVGSRKYTAYGKRVAAKLAKECSLAGLSIVSGLALGIDGEAHRSALDCNGITVGVLGCGLDRIYPSAHLGLAREIIQRGGAIISEYPPGTTAFKSNFPARNRIIAGLSLGTLVIEAGEGSGSLITAECALEYNREVFAVPGPIDSDYSRGTNLLIQKGAKLVMSIEDVLEELPVEQKKSQNAAKEILPESEEESLLLSLLNSGEQVVDFLIQESGMNIISVNTALTMMEMKGMIENVGGGRYKKIC